LWLELDKIKVHICHQNLTRERGERGGRERERERRIDRETKRGREEERERESWITHGSGVR
jgi:hypothetical protein